MREFTKSEQQRIRNTISSLGLCSCGTATTNSVLRELLERAEKGICFYDSVSDASARWGEFGAKVLDAHQLLEHGTSIGWAWLTPDGELYLEYLKELGDEEEEPRWSYEDGE